MLVSDVPAHLMGAGQMAALDIYVKGMGGGLIMAGGEDSFGSGGYERTTIEQHDAGAVRLREDQASSPTSRSCS